MKKLLMLILSLSMATVALTACDLDSLFDTTSEVSSNVSTSSEELPSDDASETPSDSYEEPSESTEPEKQEFTVTFQQAGQQDVVLTVEEGATVAEEDIPTPVQEAGYTIVWNAEELAQLNNISANVTVSTVKTANTYTVTFESEGVDAPAAKSVTYNTEVVLDALEREGYTFDGWFIKDTATQVVSGPWTIANDVTLVAKWTEKGKATITFVYADGTADASTWVYVNNDLTNVPNPQEVAKTGYTVDTKWYADSECTTEANFENITASMTVYAKVTANTYTITYAANGGTVASETQDVVYDSEVTLAVPTRANYTFNNWTDASGKVVTDGVWQTANNVTLTANWTENAKATITFVYADGTTDNSMWVYVNNDLTNVPNPQDKGKVGYTVDANWYTDNTYTTVANFANITASMTVYAKATAKTYTVQLNADGGTGVAATMTATYGEEVTLDMPTKEGYNFLGWYDGDTFVAKDAAFTWNYDNDNMTLTAKWTAKTYTVTLNLNGGEGAATSMTVTYGAAYELPTPVRDEYTFIGWKYNGTLIASNGTWTYDAAGETIEFVAEWKAEEWTQNY